MGKKCVVWSQTAYHLWNWIYHIDTNVLVTVLGALHVLLSPSERFAHRNWAFEGWCTCPRYTAIKGRLWDSTPDMSFCLCSFERITLPLNSESLDKVNVLLNNAEPWYSALRFMKCFHFYIIYFIEQLFEVSLTIPVLQERKLRLCKIKWLETIYKWHNPYS